MAVYKMLSNKASILLSAKAVLSPILFTTIGLTKYYINRNFLLINQIFIQKIIE